MTKYCFLRRCRAAWCRCFQGFYWFCKQSLSKNKCLNCVGRWSGMVWMKKRVENFVKHMEVFALKKIWSGGIEQKCDETNCDWTWRLLGPDHPPPGTFRAGLEAAKKQMRLNLTVARTCRLCYLVPFGLCETFHIFPERNKNQNWNRLFWCFK